jgi:hypothetical protein
MFEPGDRIEVTGVMDDPDPLPVGSRGTVMGVLNPGSIFEQVDVEWDSRRTLMLIPHDYRIVKKVVE